MVLSRAEVVMLRDSVPVEILPIVLSAFEQELQKAERALSEEQFEEAWSLLSRAHVLGQAWNGPHARVHVAMIRYGLRRRKLGLTIRQVLILLSNPNAMQWLYNNTPPSAAKTQYNIWLDGYRVQRMVGGNPTVEVDMQRLRTQILGGATALLPMFAKDILHTGPWGLGLLRAAPALGALGTALLLARWPIRQRAGTVLLAAVGVYGAATLGGTPEEPGLAPLAAIRRIWQGEPLAQAEIMEAYAVQALAVIDGAGLDPQIVNPAGGGLARGHPIGASGAILAVRLFHGLRQGRGLAAIAAAGGIGTALLVEAPSG